MSQAATDPAAFGAAGLQVGLLGGFSVRHGDAHVLLPASTRRLVTVLALERRQWSRSRVCGLLWADHDELRAHANLRTVLWRVRHSAPSLVDVTSGALRLSPAVAVDVDEVATLARHLDDGSPLDVDGIDPHLFGLELLPDWSEEFVDLHRETCRQVGLHALESLARRLLEGGQPARALQAGLAAVVQAPLRESAHRVVIEVHLAEGNMAEALRQFDVLADRLWHELHVWPSRDLQDLMTPSVRAARIDGPPRPSSPSAS